MPHSKMTYGLFIIIIGWNITKLEGLLHLLFEICLLLSNLNHALIIFSYIPNITAKKLEMALTKLLTNTLYVLFG